MRRFFAILLSALMLMSMIPLSVSAALVTTPATTVLDSAQDLFDFAEAVNGGDNFENEIVKLGADIALVDEWTPIAGFKGEFDGQGHTISNIWNDDPITRKGFFTSISYAYIHDLKLDGVKFTCTEAVDGAYIGTLACGGNTFTVIENVSVSNVLIDYDNITGSDIGGLGGEAIGYSQVRNVTLSNIKIDVNNSGDTGNSYTYIGGVMTKVFGATHPNNDTYGPNGSNRNDQQKHWFTGVENVNGGPQHGYFNNVDIDGLDIDTTGNVMVAGFVVYDSQNLGWAGTYQNCNITGLDVNVANSDSRATIAGFYGNFSAGEKAEGTDLDYKTFVNCSVEGNIVSQNEKDNCRIGGFIGNRNGVNATAENCTTNIVINAAAGNVGGFIGVGAKVNDNRVLTLTNCHAQGDIVVENGTAGGLIGTIDATNNTVNYVVENCSAPATVPAVGGDQGANDDLMSSDNFRPSYKITWANYDDSVLKTDTVLQGDTPAYVGETPTKAADAEFTYSFKGWDKEIVAATANAVYTATFTATPIPEEPTPEPEKPAKKNYLPMLLSAVTQVKVIDAENETAIAGATFELFRYTTSGKRVSVGTFTSNDNGKFTVRSMSPRFTYELVQLTALDGYDVLETPVTFRVRYNSPLYQTIAQEKTPVVEETPAEETPVEEVEAPAEVETETAA